MIWTISRRTICLPLLTAALLVFLTTNAFAIDWSGAGDGTQWSDGANWVGGVAPGAADEAFFNIDATVLGAPATIGNVWVEGGATVTISTLAAGATFELTDAFGIVMFDNSVLTFGDFAVVNAVAGQQFLFLSNGCALTINGDYEVQDNAAGFTECYSESTCLIIIEGNLRLFGQFYFEIDTLEAIGARIPFVLNGDLQFLASNSVINAFEFMDQTWLQAKFIEFTMRGDIDASALAAGEFCGLDFLLVDLVIPAGATCTVIAGGDTAVYQSLYAGNACFLGNLLCTGSFNFAPNAFGTTRPVFWNIRNSGTVNLADAPIGLGGTIEDADGFIENTGSFSCAGDVNAPGIILTSGGVANLQIQYFIGVVPFAGSVRFSVYTWLVQHNASASFNGGVTITDTAFDDEAEPILGVDEDGATVSGRGLITIGVQLTVTAVRQIVYALGEGTHTINGDIDFSTSDNKVILPDPLNDEEAIINMFGGAGQTIDFSAGGSYWFVSRLGAGSRVVQSGTMILAGDFDTSNANAGNGWVANGAADEITVGDGTFPVDCTVLMGDTNVLVEQFTVPQVNNGNPADRTTVTITRNGAGSGLFAANNMTVEGDTIDNGGADLNNAHVTFDNARARMGNATGGQGAGTGLRIGNGSTAVAGFGAEVTVTNGGAFAVPTDASLVNGNGGAATGTDAGAKFFVDNITMTFGDNSGLVSNSNSTLTSDTATWTSASGDSWGFNTTGTTLSLQDGTVTAGSNNSLSVSITGGSLSAVGNAFSRYTTTGVSISGTNITAFNQNTFRNGRGNGAHLTLNALTNARLNADSNEFDDSVDSANAGLLVNTAASPARLTFRHADDDHGFGGFNIDSAEAENVGDNDGVGATDVLWATAPVLDVVNPGAGNQPGAFITDNTDHAILCFNLEADNNASSTVTAITFTFSGTPSIIGATLKLYIDGGTICELDTPADVQQGANTVAASNTVTIAGLNILIPINGTVRMLLAANFGNSQTNGTMTVSIQPGGITEAANNIVNGLPISNTISGITGPVFSLVITRQPANGGPNARFGTQPRVELRDISGQLVVPDSSTQVEALIETETPGGATLTGTLQRTASSGIVTWTNLTLDIIGTYTLRFRVVGNPAIFTISASFDVTAAGGRRKDIRTGFGCAGSSDPASSSRMLLALLALLLALVAGRARRRLI